MTNRFLFSAIDWRKTRDALREARTATIAPARRPALVPDPSPRDVVSCERVRPANKAARERARVSRAG
jgi:hypothetical protein